jgi:flagellar hook assembly protein FlgD
MRIDYALFQVDRAVPVSFTVYDLTGRAVFGQSTSQSNGARTVRWDGLNDTGQLVAPGLYVWRLSADTDIEEYTETGIVAVVY